MFRWFRFAPPARETALAMVDPRPGDALLVVGASAPRLAALCAAVTGLNGRAVVVGRRATDKSEIDTAAGKAGALIEFIAAPPAKLPLDPNIFDVIVIPKLDDKVESTAAMLAEAVRVAKPAGRIIAITGEKRRRLLGVFSPPTEGSAAEANIGLLKNAGTVAARRLAEVDGVGYYEARKPRPT